MNEANTPVSCTACGRTLPRADMFGIEPDLLCPPCAEGVRKRMHVRFRPLQRDRTPVLTGVFLAIAAALFVATDMIYSVRSGGEAPAWLLWLHQDYPIWAGEVWRHVTCMFLHGGWWHILMNGFALWYLGRVIESTWGTLAFAGLMLGTGAFASAVEWIMSSGGVGLSGGLFGLCGFLWALRRVHPVATAVMNERQLRWILSLLVLGIILSASGRMPIGNWAHGGGLASGYAIGMAVRHRDRKLWVPVCAVGIVAVVVASVFLALGTVRMEKGAVWPRAQWRAYWLEHHAGRR